MMVVEAERRVMVVRIINPQYVGNGVGWLRKGCKHTPIDMTASAQIQEPLWSFDVSRKGGVNDWLEVTIYSSVWRLCLMYLADLN